MDDDVSSPVLETRRPTPSEDRWFEEAEKLPFMADQSLARFADKLLGLSTAIIAAYVAGLKAINVTLTWYGWIPIILFTISLLTALLSIFPRRVSAEFSDLGVLKKYYLKRTERRWRLITAGFVSYFFGIVVGILVMLV
jgi:hypothetical protein